MTKFNSINIFFTCDIGEEVVVNWPARRSSQTQREEYNQAASGGSTAADRDLNIPHQQRFSSSFLPAHRKISAAMQ